MFELYYDFSCIAKRFGKQCELVRNARDLESTCSVPQGAHFQRLCSSIWLDIFSVIKIKTQFHITIKYLLTR